MEAQVAANLVSLGWSKAEILSVLESEKDANYRFKSGRNTFVAKIFHPDTHPADVDLMLRAISLAKKGKLQVPTASPIHQFNNNQIMLVFDYIRGSPLGEACSFRLDDEMFWDTLRSASTVLGKLCQSLSQFPIGKSVSARKQLSEWNLLNFSRITNSPESTHWMDSATRKLSIEVLDRFEAFQWADLVVQLVHYDCNLDNLLVLDPPLTGVGVIDFGDVDLAPRVTDLCIFLTYVLGQVLVLNEKASRVDFDKILKMVTQNFESENPITGKEKKVIPTFILARAIMSVCIQSGKSTTADSKNKGYLTKSIAANKALLQHVASVTITEYFSWFNI